MGFRPQVEHPVGLVENEDPDVVEGDQTPLEHVVQTARRADDDVRGACALRLRGQRHATVDGRDPQILRCGERGELLCDLSFRRSRVG
jgi:hypothetical protein